jgi:ribose transport system permease protein
LEQTRTVETDEIVASAETMAPRPATVETAPVDRRSATRRWVSGLTPQRIGAVYILVVISVIFSFWEPSTFPKWATVRQVLDTNSMIALASLAIIIPLCAGVFDLTVSYVMTLSGMLTAYLIARGAPIVLAIGAALAVALFVGFVNGLVVVVCKIDSLIGTLAMGSLITAAIAMINRGNTINSIRLSGSFSDVAQAKLFGFTLPVFYVLIVATAIWYCLEHTATGRRIYAVGFNREAARLAGIQSDRLWFGSLMVSAGLAGITGVVLASRLSAGAPTAGNPYLLPAFAAAFLGATQLKEGRFNAWGTLIAVVLLGVGTTGLGLAHAPSWSGSMFTGVVLISSLAVAGLQRRKAAKGVTPTGAARRWPWRQTDHLSDETVTHPS